MTKRKSPIRHKVHQHLRKIEQGKTTVHEHLRGHGQKNLHLANPNLIYKHALNLIPKHKKTFLEEHYHPAIFLNIPKMTEDILLRERRDLAYEIKIGRATSEEKMIYKDLDREWQKRMSTIPKDMHHEDTPEFWEGNSQLWQKIRSGKATDAEKLLYEQRCMEGWRISEARKDNISTQERLIIDDKKDKIKAAEAAKEIAEDIARDEKRIIEEEKEDKEKNKTLRKIMLAEMAVLEPKREELVKKMMSGKATDEDVASFDKLDKELRKKQRNLPEEIIFKGSKKGLEKIQTWYIDAEYTHGEPGFIVIRNHDWGNTPGIMRDLSGAAKTDIVITGTRSDALKAAADFDQSGNGRPSKIVGIDFNDITMTPKRFLSGYTPKEDRRYE